MVYMTGTGVLAIARKEFFDHLISRKFLVIVAILLIVAVVGILSGISDYQSAISTYNYHQKTASHEGDAQSAADLTMKTKPSVLLVFYQMGLLFEMMGAILGIAMGFDLVTKEKESKSLKILLAHPVYRDQVINGKALGGIAAIVLALGTTMVLSGAILLLSGIVPEPSELPMILLFCAATFLLIFGLFSIAIFMSTICEESGRALVYTLLVFVMLYAFIPSVIMSPVVMEHVLGPAPEMPDIDIGAIQKAAESGNKEEADRLGKQNREAMDTFNRQSLEYSQKQMDWMNLEFLFSPVNNYERISIFLTNPTARSEILYPTTGMSGGNVNTEDPEMLLSVMMRKVSDFDLSQILAMLAGNIAAMVIMPAVFFGMAYVCFMRMDIR
jgi:ABC-2 type transport system permease protein